MLQSLETMAVHLQRLQWLPYRKNSKTSAIASDLELNDDD
jgi:hypothetical protein